MKNEIIYVSGVETTEQENMLMERLQNMIGVYNVAIDSKVGEIKVEFDTPANLNSIEKRYMIQVIEYYIKMLSNLFLNDIFLYLEIFLKFYK